MGNNPIPLKGFKTDSRIIFVVGGINFQLIKFGFFYAKMSRIIFLDPKLIPNNK